MPNIRTYSPQRELGIQISDRAGDSAAQAGRSIGRNYNEAGAAYDELGRRVGGTIAQVGKAYDDEQARQEISEGKGKASNFEAHKEISTGSLTNSQILLERQDAWNQRVKTADPNDPALQGQFLEENEKIFDKFKSGFTTKRGQEWAEHRVEAMRNHFQSTTTADVSTLAGVAVHNNFVQGTNMLVSMVDKDPHAVHMAADMLQDNVKSLEEGSPNLKGTAAVKFRTDATQKGMELLVKSAVQSSIRQGGTGEEISKDPRFAPYINGAERQQFERQEKQQRSAERTDRLREEQEQRRVAKDASEATRGAFIDNVFTNDPQVKKLTTQDVIENKSLLPADKEHLIRVIRNETDGGGLNVDEAKENAVKMIIDIRNGKISDTTEIVKALADKKLDYTRFQQVENEFRKVKDPEGATLTELRGKFMSAYQHIVNPKDSAGEFHREGYARQFNLEAFAREREAELRKQGTNPTELYNRNSKEFIGKAPLAQGPTPFEVQQEMLSISKQRSAKPESPPAGYPDARKAPDGDWYIQRDGKYLKVK